MFAQQTVGLKITQKEVMMPNVPKPSPVKVNGDLPITKEFTYLSSTVRHDSRAGSDIKNRPQQGTSRNAFRKQTIDQAKTLPELRTFHPGGWQKAKNWPPSTPRTLEESYKINILGPETISSQHLLACCNQDCMGTIIMPRQWRWIGHVMRREPGNISTVFHWTPERKWKRRWPKNT